MAKPSSNQKDFFKQLRTLLLYFESTNDINSPSHSTNIDNLKEALNDDLSKDAFEAIGQAVLVFARKIK